MEPRQARCTARVSRRDWRETEVALADLVGWDQVRVETDESVSKTAERTQEFIGKRPAGCPGVGFADAGGLIQNVTIWITHGDDIYIKLSRLARPQASTGTGAARRGRPWWSYAACG